MAVLNGKTKPGAVVAPGHSWNFRSLRRSRSRSRSRRSYARARSGRQTNGCRNACKTSRADERSGIDAYSGACFACCACCVTTRSTGTARTACTSTATATANCTAGVRVHRRGSRHSGRNHGQGVQGCDQYCCSFHGTLPFLVIHAETIHHPSRNSSRSKKLHISIDHGRPIGNMHQFHPYTIPQKGITFRFLAEASNPAPTHSIPLPWLASIPPISSNRKAVFSPSPRGVFFPSRAVSRYGK